MTKDKIDCRFLLIPALDSMLKDVPKSLYPHYAKLFQETIIETIIFSGESFGEASSIYCEEMGWTRPR
mgnify:CR=1 FL=1